MTAKKRLLLAGGGYADIPMIQAARRLGYHVITSGNRPEELGHAHGDEYRAADFSNLEAMLDLARGLDLQAVVPNCNDFSAISSAYIAEQLGLPGHDPLETALLIHHKDRFRAYAQAKGLPVPKASSAEDLRSAIDESENLRYPIIVKPVDLSGGKGVSRVQAPGELRMALEKAFCLSRSGRVVLEEFLSGSRHGFSVFLVDGRVRFHFADNEHYYLNPYLVSAASTPAHLPSSAIEELCNISEWIAADLRLVTGIFHIQFILQEGRPQIIEICRRPPGDLYVSLVQYSTGVDYPHWIVRGFAGLPCGEMHPAENHGSYIRHCVMPPREGVLRHIVFDPALDGTILDRFVWGRPGDRITDAQAQKFGIVFLRMPVGEDGFAWAERLPDLIRPIMDFKENQA